MDYGDGTDVRWVNPPEAEAAKSYDSLLAERQEEQHRRKKERCREYARRKRKELDMVGSRAPLVYSELVRLGVYGKLSDEAKEFFDIYVHREEAAQRPYPPTLYKMFDGEVYVGSSCTLKEAMQRLYKGKNEINFLIRKWAKAGGAVVGTEPADDGDALGMRYVILELNELRGRDSVSDVREIMSDREKREFSDYEF